ncbi:hypothetical protein FRC09_002062 [Ceratobasidium sp. 395]|nr:hypothetical protein FRC09_002062 [Ceratobasidium sp. 395]
MVFKFKPCADDLTPHGQLQEWADYFHVDLKWKDDKTPKQGVTEWSSYPIIQGVHYQEFVGVGGALMFSRAAATERIIACLKTL